MPRRSRMPPAASHVMVQEVLRTTMHAGAGPTNEPHDAVRERRSEAGARPLPADVSVLSSTVRFSRWLLALQAPASRSCA